MSNIDLLGINHYSILIRKKIAAKSGSSPKANFHRVGELTQKNQIDFTAMAILVVLCASWGLQQVAVKVANQAVSPILQAGMRSVGASILLWVWMTVHRQPILEKDGTLWWGIAAGLLFTAEFILVYWGLEFTNASRAIIFINMSPFVVALGAQLFIPGEQYPSDTIDCRLPCLSDCLGCFHYLPGLVLARAQTSRIASCIIHLSDANFRCHRRRCASE